ncbi:Uncharacterized protein TCAP_04520 [Tolypocladium capitatum]|uniref:EKC/KEOPS complex subunit BUD32 n=1 Tax=Tolypocladium capitatum TaxID=45235 RepID=A0A2K3QDC4_9HYPO|nr:Uncharacterized protein TCAP_04520 [Tolypocladium capitatum]
MMKPPGCTSKFKFLSRGATGWVLQIDKDIVLKYTRDGRGEAFEHENATYDILETHEPSPYLLQSFLRRPGMNFLDFMHGGSLDKRIRDNQLRDSRGNLIEVSRKESKQKSEQWAMELAGAIAWLESLGLVHGDLRPANILIDHSDHIKLADFDCVSDIGSQSHGNAPPWARLQGREAGAEIGTWGTNGPRTEQFAFGSILYTITRGFQPYEDQEPGPNVVQWLQNMDFPELSDNQVDEVIHRCWRGLYRSVGDLAEETAILEGAITIPRATALDDQYITKLRDRCCRLLDEEFLDIAGGR